MRGSRAKKLRKLVDGFDMPTHNYMDIKFNRKYMRRVYKADGTYDSVPDTYPVRTIFLAKCKRAAYRRLKRKPVEFQNRMLTLLQGM